MTRQLSNVFSFLRDERGQDLIKYTLMVGFVAIAIVPEVASGVVKMVSDVVVKESSIRMICAMLAVFLLGLIVLRRRSQ